jgi:hypothetical protein
VKRAEEIRRHRKKVQRRMRRGWQRLAVAGFFGARAMDRLASAVVATRLCPPGECNVCDNFYDRVAL